MSANSYVHALSVAVAAGSLALAVGGCSPKDGTLPIGTSSHGGSEARTADGGTEGESGADILPKGYATTFRKLNAARFVSLGHAPGRWGVDVYANELANEAIANGARTMPVGAVLIEEHFERAEGGAKGPVMMMTKRDPGYAPEHGDWQWTVVGALGRIAVDGVAESCAGCHDDAPSDRIFAVDPTR